VEVGSQILAIYVFNGIQSSISYACQEKSNLSSLPEITVVNFCLNCLRTYSRCANKVLGCTVKQHCYVVWVPVISRVMTSFRNLFYLQVMMTATFCTWIMSFNFQISPSLEEQVPSNFICNLGTVIKSHGFNGNHLRSVSQHCFNTLKKYFNPAM